MGSSLVPGFPSSQGRVLGKTGKPRAVSPDGSREGGITVGNGPLLAVFPGGKLSEGWVRRPLWSGGFRQWLSLATSPVSMIGVLEEVPAVDVGAEAGAGQESPCQLAVQGIGLFGRWAEPVLQQDRDEALHSAGSVTCPKVIGALGGEGLPQNHHSLHVGI